MGWPKGRLASIIMQLHILIREEVLGRMTDRWGGLCMQTQVSGRGAGMCSLFQTPGSWPLGSFFMWSAQQPWGRAWQPTPVFLPGERHGQSSLEGCSPRGRKESDRMEGAQHAQTQQLAEEGAAIAPIFQMRNEGLGKAQKEMRVWRHHRHLHPCLGL